jgi:hypothetical protein
MERLIDNPMPLPVAHNCGNVFTAERAKIKADIEVLERFRDKSADGSEPQAYPGVDRSDRSARHLRQAACSE